jgi:hypothetical protein
MLSEQAGASDRLCERTPFDLRQSLAPRCRSQTALQCVVQCVPTSKLQQPFDTLADGFEYRRSVAPVQSQKTGCTGWLGLRVTDVFEETVG